MKARYCPEIFDVPDMRRAREIILTNEGPGADTDTRWEYETPYVLELINAAISLRPETVVLDYGCGIGRMAKAMIDASGCSVIGVDSSANMRKLAPDYVGSDRFVALSPGQFDLMVAAGLRVGAAIAVWVLQHCLKPADDIRRIRDGMAPDGTCFVLNMPTRAVPATVEVSGKRQFLWVPDDIDVAASLRSAFHVTAEGVPDTSRVPNMADVGAYWMTLAAQRQPPP
jgi:SAM-dependent methyltransferase